MYKGKYKPESELTEAEVRALYEVLRVSYLESQVKHHTNWRLRPQNKDKRKEYMKLWVQNNKDKVKENSRRFREKQKKMTS